MIILKILKWIGFGFLLLVVGTLASIYIPNSLSPDLGVENGRLKPLKETPNGVSTQAQDTTKLVSPWPMKETPAQTIEAIIGAVDSYGGAKIKTQTEDYVYVVFTTPLMKFQDDAEFYLDAETQQVQYRSNSRVGSGDGGLNRDRFDQLTELYMR